MYEECTSLLEALLEAKSAAGVPLLDPVLRERAQLCMALVAEGRDEAAANEKFASLGRLAAAVLHELLNPLAYLQTNLEVLSANLPALVAGEAARDQHLRDDTKLLVEESRGGVERISVALSALRILLREEPSGPVRGDVRRAAQAASRLVSMRLPQGISLQQELPEVPPVSCGDALVGQVLLHLLLRSLDALDGEPGTIALRCRNAPPDWVVLEVEHEGGTKATGNELGFSLAQHLVERAGGHLERVDSTGPGAQFVVHLPVAEAES